MTSIVDELEQQICHKEHETVFSKIIKIIKLLFQNRNFKR